MTGPRSFTRTQALENRAFLDALSATGNVREAARAVGAHRAKFTRRRASHPAFAAEWDAALTLASANLRAAHPAGRPAPELVRRRDGTLQLRARRPERLTHAARQAFLRALSATCNVRLSARAAGFTHAAFYAVRARDPAFAREWRRALATGHARIEAALVERLAPDSHADDDWCHNEPPAMPRMTFPQALQLLALHRRTAHDLGDLAWRPRRRRGEIWDLYILRLREAAADHERRELEDNFAAFCRRLERRPPRGAPPEPPPPALPDLEQVTGWSKADPTNVPHDPGRGLFGGWEIGDWKR